MISIRLVLLLFMDINNNYIAIGVSRRKVKMKKVLSSILIVILLLLLTTCEREPDKPEMYIEVAQLSEQEKNILQLIGANNSQLICDFMLDENVESIQVNSYELIEGEWCMQYGGTQRFSDESGRLAITFDDIPRGFQVALQEEDGSSIIKHSNPYLIEESRSTKQESVADVELMGRTTSLISELTEIIYEEEIPLAIQISTSKDSIFSYIVEYFFTPEEYQKHDYEHVYAITVLFSQKMMGE